MATILNKKQMSEEDIKLNYITPALLNKGWQNKITMETSVNINFWEMYDEKELY